jgi:hypothetical protein
MFYYKIENQTVVGKYNAKPRAEHVESQEDWSLGSSYIDGVFGEPVKTKAEQLVELRKKYSDDLDSNALKIANAIADDGVDEEANKLALQTARAGIKAKFQTDQISIITG